MTAIRILGTKRHFPVKIAAHACCWMIFIVYELAVARYTYGRLEPAYVYGLFYALNISFFYSHAAVLTYTFRRTPPHYVRGLLAWAALLIGYLVTRRLLDFLLEKSDAHVLAWAFSKALLAGYLFRSTYFMILSAAFWSSGYIVYFRTRTMEAEKRQLAAARDQAELKNALLQQQINPHMLFNTLNFIYSDVYAGSPKAARSVLLLSDIIRFGLEATGNDGKTPVSAEIVHIRQLLEINRYRFHHDLNLDFRIQGEFEGLRIIPLVLLTLTENVFKHGNLKNPAFPAAISLTTDAEGKLAFRSMNQKKAAAEQRQSRRLGLKNILFRLDFAYPERYHLDIGETESTYELNLTVLL